jgi:calcineurin-like phosphoesterase family protein
MKEAKERMTLEQQLEYINENPLIKEEMESIFFSADPHDSHPKIIEICGRPTTIEDHRRWLIEDVYNKYVGKKDRLYLLGDVSFAAKVEAETKFLSKLNGQKTLIVGNHDKNIRTSTYFGEITQIKNFTFSRGILNIHIVLCHFPIASWDRKVYGSFHLHGHTHGRFVNHGLSWDTGIDNKRTLITSDDVILSHIWKPINLFEVCQIMTVLGRDTPGESTIINI